MSSYVPNSKIPMENLLQEMEFARGRPANPHGDIILPSYIIDQRVIKAIEREIFDYVESYARKCPNNTLRYFFLEDITSLKPVKRHITVGTLLGYACRHRAHDCIRVLMQHGAKPLQPSYILDWNTSKEGAQAMEITEMPSIALLASMFHKCDLKTLAKTFSYFKNEDVDFNKIVEIRHQVLQQPKGTSTKTIQFKDAWECLEKEIEKTQGATLTTAKASLKQIHSAYNTDQLQPLFEKTKPHKGK
ncbi:unnamed protein product [Schistocephalus solidus]|uniref:ANK_REP_REGION domain-containing protein n=2 Tax=Schistocephalus solidus TaxID=70667 RepID=A0A183SQ56_SCHSO|nr:unnamed protein product [Schistocephalus solidus]